MTDKLIIMEPTPYATEGFIKLEDGTRLTVAFNAPDGEYLFISGKLYKSFGSKAHLHLTVPPSSKIDDCAIYRKDGDTAYAVLFHGDIAKLDRALTQLCGLKAEYPGEAPREASNARDLADNDTDLSFNGKHYPDNTCNSEDKRLDNDSSNGEDKRLDNDSSNGEDKRLDNDSSNGEDKRLDNFANDIKDNEAHSRDHSSDTAFQDNTALFTHSADNTKAFDDDAVEDIISLKEPSSTKCPETFWECNKERFSAIFESNESNDLMRELIPGSEWVNVTEENYLLGLINDEDGEPLYICYGFSLPWSDTPPEQLEGYCQWIPCDFSHPHEDGYWVIYINARTGERIK